MRNKCERFGTLGDYSRKEKIIDSDDRNEKSKDEIVMEIILGLVDLH
jgi:hypothetical protein